MSEAITSLDNLENGFYLFRLDAKKTFLYENRAENGGTVISGDAAGNFQEGQLLVSWAGNSSDDVASFKTSFEGISKNMLSYVVRVTKNDDGTFQLQFRSGKYMPSSLNLGWDAAANSGDGDSRRVYPEEEPGKIVFTYISGTYFKFKGQDGQYYAEGWGGNHQTGKFCGAADGDAVKYEIFPVTLADKQPVSCTFTAQDANGNVLATITQNEQKGEAVSNPFKEYSYFYAPTFVESDLVASESNHEFHVTFTESDVPFTFSTADAPVWYTIHFRKEADNKYLRHVNASDGNISSGQTVSADNGYASFNGALWAFVREGLGVKLLCKQTGTYVTVENANDGQAAKLDANGMAFIVKTNSSDPNASDPSVSSTGFSLKYPGVDNAYLGDHATNNLGMWTPTAWWADSQNDAGSCYQIALADVSDIVNVGIASFDHNTAVNEAQGNYLTAGSNDAAVQAAKKAVQSATTLAQLDAAYEKLTRYAYPEAGAYYLIKNVSTSEYVHTDKVTANTDGILSDANVYRGASSNFVAKLWQFESDENGSYYVKDANSSAYFSSNNGEDKNIYLTTEAASKGSFTLKAFPSVNTENANINLQLRLNDVNRMNAYHGPGYTDLSYWDGGDNPDGDAGSYWTFEKVTAIPVQILETGWTSVCYPFAVTIPAESTVKAYYAENTTTDGLQLNEVEGNVIPANQGVFLVNMEGATTVNLEITNDATAALDNNFLSGATAKREGFAGNDTYLLGKSNNDDKPALLKSTLTWVPANKAYFLASKLSNGLSKLSLSFGQNTGIEDAAANAAQSETYYDLNGRVVLYPQHGIFVTKSGRKVYVK